MSALRRIPQLMQTLLGDKTFGYAAFDMLAIGSLIGVYCLNGLLASCAKPTTDLSRVDDAGADGTGQGGPRPAPRQYTARRGANL